MKQWLTTFLNDLRTQADYPLRTYLVLNLLMLLFMALHDINEARLLDEHGLTLGPGRIGWMLSLYIPVVAALFAISKKHFLVATTTYWGSMYLLFIYCLIHLTGVTTKYGYDSFSYLSNQVDTLSWGIFIALGTACLITWIYSLIQIINSNLYNDHSEA